MTLKIKHVDGAISTVENVREFSYNYEVPYFSVWFIDEIGRMKKIVLMTELIEYIFLESEK